ASPTGSANPRPAARVRWATVTAATAARRVRRRTMRGSGVRSDLPRTGVYRDDGTNGSAQHEEGKNCVPAASLLVLPLLHQLHLDVGRYRFVLRRFRQLHTNGRLAGLSITGDPNRAVVQHPSAALLQFADEPLLLFHPVSVDQRCPHPLAVGQEVLLGGAETAAAKA